MLQHWPKRDPNKHYYLVPNEVFNLGLSSHEIAVYNYLLRCEDRRTYQCHPSYRTIGKAVQLSENTVRKYVAGLEEKGLTSTCTGVEMFRKLLDEGEAGDNVGLLLRGIDKKEVKRGMVVAKPGSITPHTKFQAEVYILKKEEGGRHTPFHNKYRPQFYLRTMDVTGEVTLPEGVDMVMPGDHVTITVELIYPVALNEGLRFAIREGGRTVGAGQILKILA